MMRRHGIRHRLNLIIVGAIAIGLLATFAMFSVRDVQQRRGALLTELHSMADVIAFNAAAVIEFEDRTGAERLFGALGQHQDIVYAEMRSLNNDFSHVLSRGGAGTTGTGAGGWQPLADRRQEVRGFWLRRRGGAHS